MDVMNDVNVEQISFIGVEVRLFFFPSPFIDVFFFHWPEIAISHGRVFNPSFFNPFPVTAFYSSFLWLLCRCLCLFLVEKLTEITEFFGGLFVHSITWLVLFPTDGTNLLTSKNAPTESWPRSLQICTRNTPLGCKGRQSRKMSDDRLHSDGQANGRANRK